MQAVNAAALRTYGYSREEFLRLKATDLHARRRSSRASAGRCARAIRSASYTSQWRHRRKDGSVMDVEIVSYPFELDGRPARLLLVNDITERKRAERRRNLETAVTVLLADAGEH